MLISYRTRLPGCPIAHISRYCISSVYTSDLCKSRGNLVLDGFSLTCSWHGFCAQEVLLGLNQLSAIPCEWSELSSLQLLHLSGNANLTTEKVPKAIRHKVVGTLAGGSGSGNVGLAPPPACSKQGTLKTSSAEENDSYITLTTGTKVALTVPLARAAPDAPFSPSILMSSADACAPIKNVPKRGDESEKPQELAQGGPVVHRTCQSNAWPDKGGIQYQSSWSPSWDPFAVKAVNLVLHGPFNKDLAAETEEVIQAQARREAVLAKEEERAAARRAQRNARLQNQPCADKITNSKTTASVALERIDSLLAKLSRQGVEKQRTQATAGTFPLS